MRTFGASFALELLSTANRPFWTVVLHYETEDVYVSGRIATIGANVHTVIMQALTAIGSAVARSDPTQMDVLNTDLTFVNMPMRTDFPGQLAIGERLMDRWDRAVETRLAEVYLSIQLPDDSIVQEQMMAAIQGAPSNAGFRTGNLHLTSLSEKYLNASVLRKIQARLYPFAQNPGDVIPIVIGHVPQALGRVVKGSSVTQPLAADTNSSSATLLRVTLNETAVAEEWTIAFSDLATAPKYTPTCDDFPSMNLSIETGTTEPVLAQSFPITGTQQITSLIVRLKGAGVTGTYPTTLMRFGIWSDSGGVPDAPLFEQSLFVPTLGTEHARGTYLNLTVTTGTYWIVLFASPGGHPYGAWSPLTGTSLRWCAKTSGSYAGGTALHGTRPRQTYANASAFTSLDITGDVTWDGTLSGYDFWFALGFGSSDFSAVGSVTGADGGGDVSTTFESDSGALTINPADWQGTPAPGDVFTFKVDPTPSVVIFSESPAGTPVKEIKQIYINRRPVVDTADVDMNTGFEYFATIGNDVDPASVPPGDFEYRYEWRGMTVLRNVQGAETFTALGFNMLRNGEPTSPVRFVVYANARVPGATYPDRPDLNIVLASATVESSQVPSAASGAELVYGAFDVPLTVTDQKIWVMVETDSFESVNSYSVRITHDDASDGHTRGYNHNKAPYIIKNNWAAETEAFRPLYILRGADIEIDEEAIDPTGVPVALARMNFDIREGWKVTADIDGISDDGSGTFTGTAGAVLTLPDSVIHWLLYRAGVLDAMIDLAGTFAASRAIYESLGFAFAGVIDKDVTYKQMILQLAFESRSTFAWHILATLRYQPDALPAAVAAFTLDDFLKDSEREPIYRTERSSQSEQINSISVGYNRNFAEDKYPDTMYRLVPSSIDEFGVLELTNISALEFVRSETMARAVVDARLQLYAWPFWRHFFTTLLPFLAVEQEDAASLDLTNGADVFGGWDGTQILQVENTALDPSRFSVDFILRERVETDIVDGDEYGSPGIVVVLLDQDDLTTRWDYVMGFPPIGKWSEPSIAGGDVYDAIAVPGPAGDWYVYIEDGVRKWRDTTFTTVYDWGSNYPPARVNDDELLEIDI